MLKSEKYRFIECVINGKIVLSNRAKADILKDLERLEFKHAEQLLNMPIGSLTKEQMQKLKQNVQEIEKELNQAKQKSEVQMWIDDLANL
ncbi:DNA gyrase subunit A [Aeromonas caviae]|uniref:DNA gyrase subunit A n=1 Tax=Aeromonas TaxID=642 RepID=UPI00160400FC|nr:DNA gyrase subunit A [Aeromonas caviae]MCR3947752.1 hypothetical protein [Aeromonas caviae]MDH0317466.1 hypothetical protein [Aeromonas caviae]MDH1451949.1 hypothetical protein [Aeromonas caviae]MDH1496810.1 hypothetical protein [Aeromonas caviae]WMX36389.1 DNA gyrase subunit A [Aeromonas caviae]